MQRRVQAYRNWHDLQLQYHQWEPQEGNGVYLFIKFPEMASEYVAQTAVLSKRGALTARGRFIGIARKIMDLNHVPRHPEALLVYLFESTSAAKTFFFSDNRLKQPDFPHPFGLCQAWTVVKFLDTRDDQDFTTYMMCETSLKYASYSRYKQDFVQPMAGLIIKHGGQPFVVQSIGVEPLRYQYKGDNIIVTVHLFRSEADVRAMMKDEAFQDLRKVQRAMADDVTSVFTIDHQACP